MLRRMVVIACFCASGLLVGCGGNDEKVDNPGNLDYSKEGPPPREGPGAPDTGGGGERPKRGGRMPTQPK